MRRIVYYLPLLWLLAACNLNSPDATPTVEVLLTATPTAEPSATATGTATPSLTPTASLTPEVVMLTPVDVPTQNSNLPSVGQPTLPPAEVATVGPWEYVIQEGDTLGSILFKQPWGYNGYDPVIQQAVVRLNGMFSTEILPPVGTTILIPQRTPTPIPANFEVTQTAAAISGVGPCGNVACPTNQQFDCHNVEEGESIVVIAEIYNTSLEMMSSLNQNLNWFGCNFTLPSGGPNCSPLISIGQCVTVPLPTPTIVPSATVSGNETATPTPTFAPAKLVYPPEGAVAPAGIFPLQWVSVGILKADEIYLIEVEDTTKGETWRQVTRDTSLMLPDTLIPTDGQVHQIRWRVSVARRDASGGYVYAGGTGNWRTFQWQSR
jgi:hypothetical protein